MPKSTLDNEGPDGSFTVLKGESGVGKSVAALSFPGIYVFDFDRKMPSIAKKHYPKKDIAYDTFNTVFDVYKVLEQFKRDCPYETLLADSYTGLGSLSFATTAFVKGERIQDMQGKIKRGGGLGFDYYTNEMADLENVTNELKTLFLQQGNPKHIIITAHIIMFDSAPDIKTKDVTKFREILARGRKAGAILPTEVDDVYLFGFEKSNDVFSSDGAEARRFCLTNGMVGDDLAKCSWPFPKRIYLDGKKSFYSQLFVEDRKTEGDEESDFIS